MKATSPCCNAQELKRRKNKKEGESGWKKVGREWKKSNQNNIKGNVISFNQISVRYCSKAH